MPARPAYFHRIAEALAVLARLPSDYIDRKILQETLGVSKTVAWRILRRCGAIAGPGNTLVCQREELILALEALQKTGEYECEIRRRSRVEENLGQLLRAARSRHISVAGENRAIGLVSTRFGKLPAGVELRPSRLTIEFSGAQDFLEKVGAVVFALQNDYEAVAQFIDEG